MSNGPKVGTNDFGFIIIIIVFIRNDNNVSCSRATFICLDTSPPPPSRPITWRLPRPRPYSEVHSGKPKVGRNVCVVLGIPTFSQKFWFRKLWVSLYSSVNWEGLTSDPEGEDYFFASPLYDFKPYTFIPSPRKHQEKNVNLKNQWIKSEV